MQRERIPCVYILASSPRGTLYIGVTSNLPGRIWQHKHDQVEGFTRKYKIHTLAWYEVHGTMESAILREKAIKAWGRVWKLKLIETANPQWDIFIYKYWAKSKIKMDPSFRWDDDRRSSLP